MRLRVILVGRGRRPVFLRAEMNVRAVGLQVRVDAECTVERGAEGGEILNETPAQRVVRLDFDSAGRLVDIDAERVRAELVEVFDQLVDEVEFLLCGHKAMNFEG